MLAIGDAKLTMLNGGNFRLDGGAMHGVVPKTLWSKLVSCDALNRCEYTTRCLLSRRRASACWSRPATATSSRPS